MQFGCRNNLGISWKFKPKYCFVGLFNHNAKFGDKFSL